ncbi:MAG: GYF domain-containing protein [Saprospiraceae bacterium]
MNEEHPPRKYYLHNGVQQTGPFLLEDLEQQNLSSTTMVWYKGLDDWQEAGAIEELLPVINHTLPPHSEELPPPFKRETGKMAIKGDGLPPGRKTIPPATEKRGSSGLTKFAWAFVLIVLLGLLIFAIQQFRSATSAMNVDATPTYEEQVLSMEDQEKATPRKFLKASGTYHETVFTGKFKIDGTITNSATVAKFKNVILEVNFYDSKDKYLRSERYTIEDVFPAGSTKEFKLKIDPPKGADNCKWKAVGATAY